VTAGKGPNIFLIHYKHSSSKILFYH